MKYKVKIDALEILDNAEKFEIIYDKKNNIIKLKTSLDNIIKSNHNKFCMYIENNINNKDFLINLLKRYIKEETLKEMTLYKVNENEIFSIYTKNNKCCEIDFELIKYNTNILNFICNRRNYDYFNEYLNNKSKIQTIYIYDSKNDSSIEYRDNKMEKGLYIFNKYNSNLLDFNLVINKILCDFKTSLIPDGYFKDEDKIVLNFKNDIRVYIYNTKYMNCYKNFINEFQNDLIEEKVKKYTYKKGDNK